MSTCIEQARRRSNRIPKVLPIVLSGSDLEGKQFSEQTKTLVLSRYGAGIVSSNKLAPQEVLILRCVDTNKEAAVRVVGQVGRTPEGYTYGVAFLDASVNLWNVDFTLQLEADGEVKSIFFECTSCHDREAINPNDIELDVYRINQTISRYCPECGKSTSWREVSGDTKPSSILSQTEPEPEANPAAPPENRRKHVRAKVKFSACIRHSGSEEIVACENISKGGFCFRGSKHYPEKSMIEVALPYSPGDPAIFVPAQIIWVQELAAEKLFRCGATYVKS